MQIVAWVIQFGLIGILMFFVVGRLLGTHLSIFKRIFSVSLSLTITSVAYWFMHIQKDKTLYTPLEDESLMFSLIIWIASLLLITMLFHLVLELFEPIHETRSTTYAKQNIFMRLVTRWKLQRRLASVLRIAFKHGIGRAFGFWRSAEGELSNARSFRLMLEECDGIFIKFGQVLSTRTDLFSETFTKELSLLQENVKPISKEIVERRLEKALGENWQQKFSDFEMEPLASGSIGQVHKAMLFEPHEKVVVKILRPEIDQLLNRDLDLLISFASWLTEESQWAENLGFLDLAIGFASSMREEINFDLELKNMQQISNALKDSKTNVVIPKVYPEYSDSTILVMEYIDGVKITEAEQLLSYNNKSENEVLSQLFNSFLIQVMTAGIFHGDPHPGNVHIMKSTAQVALLDFGAVGRIGKAEQRGLTMLFIGYHRGNADIVIESLRYLVESETHLKDKKFKQSISQLLAEFSYLDKISTTEIVQSLFAIIQKNNMRLFPMVGVALRALITLEGTLQSVSKDFDAFRFANDFTKTNTTLESPVTTAKSLKTLAVEELLIAWPVIQSLPQRLNTITENFEKGEMSIKMDFTSSETNKAFLTKWLSQFMLLLIGITFGGLSVAILAISQIINHSFIIYLNTAAYVGLFLSLIILVRLSIQVIREYKKNS
ncbi:MAG: AarF/ABC1/UbiB kinase family protein [Kurthia sp.]|nr:AarF/ABC1/UbiB kinase family protein [Candidatus Kurthia equi]